MPPLSSVRDITRALALVIAFVLALVGTSAASAIGQQPTPTFSPLAFPGNASDLHDGQQWLCMRVVDARTGAPLADAELLLIDESPQPIRGQFTAGMRATADADGFVRLAIGAKTEAHRRAGWMLVRAPGHGQRMEMGPIGEIVALAPAVDMPLVILDPLERPVADCLVGFCCGCGHTPDLVHARTDATGHCTLRGIDDRQGIRDLYLEHARLGLLYDSRDWYPGEPAVRIVAPSGHTAQGVVVDEDSKPVAGAFVGSMEVHRGPWTRTLADGSFLLCGMDQAPTDLFVQVGDRRLIFELGDTAPLRMQLPTAPPPEVSRRPGYTEVVNLAAGERSRQEAQAAAAPWLPSDAPTVIVRTIDYPADEPIRLVTETHTLDIEELVHMGAPVPLPEQPFAFVLGHDSDVRRTFSFTRQQALAAGVVHLRWFRPTRIEGRVVGTDGQPREVRLALLTPDEALGLTFENMRDFRPCAGAIALASEQQGLAVLAIQDDQGDCATRLVPVLLPPRGDDATVDVGTIVLRERPQYLLRDSAGQLLDDWQVALLRRGFLDVSELAHVRLHREGYAPVLDLEAGDVLHVQPLEEQPQIVDGKAIYQVPARFEVQGAGPWDFTLPNGQLWVRARGNDPSAKITLLVDDLHVALEEPLLLRGLTPGHHRCFVSADGHQTAIVDIEVPSEGIAELDLQLPPR